MGRGDQAMSDTNAYAPLISILQDVDRDPGVRVVMRSYPAKDGIEDDPTLIVVSVETRKHKDLPWAVLPDHSTTYNDAFKALSWATIALDKAIDTRKGKRSLRKLQPFQHDSENLEP
jgi:hypothetical protein